MRLLDYSHSYLRSDIGGMLASVSSDTGGIFGSEIFGITGMFGKAVGAGRPVSASAAPAMPDSGTAGAGSWTPGTTPGCAAPTLLGMTGMVGLPVNRSHKAWEAELECVWQ